MPDRRLTEQEIYDAIDCPEDVAEGRVLTRFVARHADGTYWLFHLSNRPEGGWVITGDTLAVQVVPKCVTTTEWVVP